MRRVILVAALVSAGVAAYRYAPTPAFLATSAQAELPTLRVRREPITESTVAIGTVKAKVGAEVKVGSQLSGIVAELRVSVGDTVAKGDLLASLNDADARARVDVLKAEVASAIAETDYAESELDRTERLRELVPELQIENLRKNLRVKQAAVERTRAALAEAQIRLGYAVIRAPVAGTIASVSTYRGETIAASLAAPTFVTIVDLKRLEVQSYVDETDIGRVRVGQRVTIRVDAFPGTDLEGLVAAIYPKAQLVNNVVNYVVIIDIRDMRDLVIRPEMTAHVNFILAEAGTS